MTIPTVPIDENAPAGNENRNLGDNRIREGKTQNREIMEVNHVYPSSGQDSDSGKHKKVSLLEQADLGTGATGKPILGAQTVSGKAALVFTDEDDNDIVLSVDGEIGSASTVAKFGATTIVGDLNVTGNILKSSTNILALVYPIGSIYISTVSTNPNTLFGFGTWSAFGAGKFLVGLNGADADFDTAEETGGSKTKNIAHTHTVPASSTGWGRTSASSAHTLAPSEPNESASCTTDLPTSSGGSTIQDILPPYIVAYMWKRTA